MHGSPIYLDGEAAVCGAAAVRGKMTGIQGKLGKRKQHSRVSGTATHLSPRSITASRYAANGTQTHRENINPHRTHRKRAGWVSRRGCTKMKKHTHTHTHTRTTNPKLKLAACPSHVCTFLAKLAHLSIERWLMVVPSGKMSSRSGNPSPVNTPSCFSRLALPHRTTTHRSQVKKEQSTKQQSPNGQR